MASSTNCRSRTERLTLWTRRSACIALLILLTAQLCSAQEGDIRQVHDPTVIRDGDDYYMFTTGLGNRPGLPIRRSRDLFHWALVGEVFPAFPQWAIDRKPGHNNLWAPHVLRMNGRFHLYYAVSTFGTNDSTIGLATNVTLNPSSPDYQWRDEGIIVETRSGRDDWNAIDPNIATDADGTPWLITGSYFAGIKAFRLNPRNGKLPNASSSGQTIARRPNQGPIEAPYVVRYGAFFYLFVSFDHCCKGTKSDYKVMVGRSKNIAGPYVDFDGVDMRQGGGTLVISGHDRFFGPGHNAVLKDGDRFWFIHHFYDGDRNGVATMQIRPLHWGKDGWPLVGEPLTSAPGDRKREGQSVVAGRWNHSVNYQPAKPLDLFANHRIVRRDGRATWALNGRDLSMRWPRPNAPGGAWVDQCILAADSQSFVGRNQRGMIVRGVRLLQDVGSTVGSWRFFDVYNKGATIAQALTVERDGSLTCRNNVRGFCLASRRQYEELELSLEFQLPPDAAGSASVYVASRLPNPDASDWRQQIPKGFEFKLGPGQIGELWLPREDFKLELPLGQLRDGRRVVPLRKPVLKSPGWNTLQVTCDEHKNVTFRVNDETINAIAKAENIAGHIVLFPKNVAVRFRNVTAEENERRWPLSFAGPGR